MKIGLKTAIYSFVLSPSHKLSAGKNATPIRVPIVAPIVAMTKSNGECKKTAKFMIEEAIRFFTAHTCPMDKAIPMPTLCQSISNRIMIKIYEYF